MIGWEVVVYAWYQRDFFVGRKLSRMLSVLSVNGMFDVMWQVITCCKVLKIHHKNSLFGSKLVIPLKSKRLHGVVQKLKFNFIFKFLVAMIFSWFEPSMVETKGFQNFKPSVSFKILT